MATVYLAGAIDKVPADYAKGWRQEAAEKLLNLGFDVCDPTRGKDLDHSEANTTLYEPKDIVETDLQAIAKSDILLVEMARDDRPYVGTSMEIRQAYIWGLFIVVWGSPTSYWVRYHADAIVEDMDEAIEVIQKAWEGVSAWPNTS